MCVIECICLFLMIVLTYNDGTRVYLVLNLELSGLIVALILSQNSFVCEGNN